jgi:GrpB-like predicted nucleotidyltransferase (UPF0157 family)
MNTEVDEPIEIVSFDPVWPRLFDEEAKRLRIGIAEQINGIEHFGSTSVVGMAGKPIVDLLFGVDDMARAHRVAEQVAELGYQNLGEVLMPGRVYLRRRGPPNFNVAVVIHNGILWNYFVMVRDYLRAHPDEVAAYSKAKRETIESGAAMFLSYSYKKAPFLQELAERAKHWKLAGLNKLAENRALHN